MRETSIFHDNLLYLIVLVSGLVLAFFSIGILMNSVLSGDEKVSANYSNELAFESDFHVLETTDSMTEKDVEKENKRIKKITPSKTEMSTMFEKLYKYKNGNVSTQVYMLVGNGKRKRNVKIYVANNVALAEEVSEYLIKPKESGEAQVLIGEDNLPYVIDGEISLDGVDVKVAGVLKNKTLKNDNRVVLLNFLENENLKNEIINLFCDVELQRTFVFGTEEEISDAYKNQLINILNITKRKFDVANSVPDYESYSDMERLMDTLKDKIFLIVSVFTFINLLAVNSLWVKRRKSEMAIRKTYGYTDLQIISEYMKEYILALFMGMGICAVAFGTYLGIYHEKIRINYVTDTIVKALMTVLIMMFFNFLLSYKYVSTVNLTNGIKER